MINQKEIARRAGVSEATVSRAFTQNANVKPATLLKIQNAMKSLGIEPISVLPATSGPGRRNVMIIVGDMAGEFWAQLIKGISTRLTQLGLFAVVCNSNYDSQIEEAHISYAQEQGFLGVIMVSVMANSGLEEKLRQATIPIIFVSRYIRSLDIDLIAIDNYRGGYIATSYLIQQGHRNIVHLTGEKNSSAPQDRLRGFCDAMQDAKLPIDASNIFWGANEWEDGYKFVDFIVKRGMPYTAVFSANWPPAVSAVQQLKKMGYEIPQDLSVICFDDSPYIDERGLNLTTVSREPYLLGIDAVDVLIRRIENPKSPTQRLLLAPRLILRSSVKTIPPATP